MNYTALKALIDTAPAELVSDNEITQWCNTPSVEVTVETFVDTRSLMAQLGPADTDMLLTKLEGAVSENPVIGRTLEIMSPANGGIDVGHAATRSQIDYLVATGVLDAGEGAALKALAERMISPAENAGLLKVRKGHVIKARAQS